MLVHACIVTNILVYHRDYDEPSLLQVRVDRGPQDQGFQARERESRHRMISGSEFMSETDNAVEEPRRVSQNCHTLGLVYEVTSKASQLAPGQSHSHCSKPTKARRRTAVRSRGTS
jgi:hypothetical protein